MIDLSIIVPVYNVEKYLKKCVFSILDQRQTETEILLVDDGSTDKSGEIAKWFQENYTGVRVIHQNNKGPSCARNQGIRLAQGKYLLFLDGDDYLVPGCIKRLKEIFCENPAPDVVVGRYISYYEDKKKYASCGYELDGQAMTAASGEQLLYEVVRNKTYNWYSVLNIVRRAYITEHHLYFDEGSVCCEDALWTPDVLFGAACVRYLKTPFYVYVQNRKGSITTEVTEKAYEDRLLACRFAERFIVEKKLSVRTAGEFRASFSPIYVSLLADSWCFNRKRRNLYLNDLKGAGSFLKCSNRRYQRMFYFLGRVIGIKGISYVLHLRAQWVRAKRVDKIEKKLKKLPK